MTGTVVCWGDDREGQVSDAPTESGFVELEVSDGGVMIYRFPEVLYAGGAAGSWARRHDSA